MTSTHWEKVGTGRYASELHGHVLQAIRKDGPYLPEDRPYLAIVDRVPIGEAWNLKIAKTKAIQFVERQNGKAKAERAFRNGTPKPAEAPLILDPAVSSANREVDAMLVQPSPPEEPPPIPPETILNDEGEKIGEYIPFTEPESPPLGYRSSELDPRAGQLAITGRLGQGAVGDAALLDTLNALRSALELLREHAELECTVNLPPILKL